MRIARHFLRSLFTRSRCNVSFFNQTFITRQYTSTIILRVLRWSFKRIRSNVLSLLLRNCIRFSVKTCLFSVDHRTITRIRFTRRFIIMSRSYGPIICGSLRTRIYLLPCGGLCFLPILVEKRILQRVALCLNQARSTMAFLVGVRICSMTFPFLRLSFLFPRQGGRVFRRSPVRRNARLIRPNRLRTNGITRFNREDFNNNGRPFFVVRVRRRLRLVTCPTSFKCMTYKRRSFAIVPSIGVRARICNLSGHRSILFSWFCVRGVIIYPSMVVPSFV